MRKPVGVELATIGCLVFILLVGGLIGASLLYTLFHNEPPPAVQSVVRKPLVEVPVPKDAKVKYGCESNQRPIKTRVLNGTVYKLYDCDRDGRPDIFTSWQDNRISRVQFLVLSEEEIDRIKVYYSYQDRRPYVQGVCKSPGAYLRFWKDAFDGTLYAEYVGCRGIDPLERYQPDSFVRLGSDKAKTLMSIFNH